MDLEDGVDARARSATGSVGKVEPLMPLTKSRQRSVLAGIWITVLQGTTIVTLFSVTVPP